MSEIHIYLSLFLIISSFFAGFVWIASEEMTPSETDDWELIPVAQTLVGIGQKASGLYLSVALPVMALNMFYIVCFCTHQP